MKKYLINLIIGAFILSFASLFNGYPLVYSDTGTYIGSGFDFDFHPLDRPVVYGLFIRFFSLNFSLWFVVIIQNLLTAFLIYDLFKAFKIKALRPIYFSTLLLLTFTTGISWYSNQIMPDFLTPLLFICLYLLLTQKMGLSKTIFITIITLFCSITHYSNLLIGSSFIFFLCIFYGLQKKLFVFFNPKKILFLLLITTFNWFALMTINKIIEDEFYLSKTNHVFIMSNLNEKGILKPFLDENCSKPEFQDCKLCALKDDLPPDDIQFLWSGKFIEQTGGWLGSKEEYDKIINGTLKEPKYLFRNIYQSTVFGLIQLTQNNVGEGLISYGTDSSPYYRINRHLNNEGNTFLNTKQIGGRLDFEFYTNLQSYLISLSLFFLVVFYGVPQLKKANKEMSILIGLTLLFIVVNAFMSAGFTSPYPRLQSRVIWLVPLTIIIVLAKNHKLIRQVLKTTFRNKEVDKGLF